MTTPTQLFLLCSFILYCSIETSHAQNKPKARERNDTTINHGYNELANVDKRTSFPVSDYNTDNPNIKNISRPSSSSITNSTIDTSLLFAIWVNDTNAPHATFAISKESFYVVDYDGDGSMPYLLTNNKLKIFYNDFIQEGDIISVNKHILKIKWKDIPKESIYIKWKN